MQHTLRQVEIFVAGDKNLRLSQRVLGTWNKNRNKTRRVLWSCDKWKQSHETVSENQTCLIFVFTCFHLSPFVAACAMFCDRNARLVSSIDQWTLAVVAHDFKMAAPMEEHTWTTNNEAIIIELWAERPSLFNIESPEYMNKCSQVYCFQVKCTAFVTFLAFVTSLKWRHES